MTFLIIQSVCARSKTTFYLRAFFTVMPPCFYLLNGGKVTGLVHPSYWGAKFHATARGLQPPACCGYPAMWWMAKRLHRVISARVVAKWGILIERGAG